jgi:RNA polymerase sigma-70 factor (ECF subfamily)
MQQHDSEPPATDIGAGKVTGGAVRPPDVACLTITEVVVRYEAYVRRIVANAGMTEEADEIVQDAFVAMNASVRKSGQMPRRVTSMLAVITTRKIRDRMRQRTATRARASETDADVLAGSVRDPERACIGAETSWIVRGILDDIPDPGGFILLQVELNEMTPDELAEALGIPLPTVYTHIRRARKRFKDLAKIRLGLGGPR